MCVVYNTWTPDGLYSSPTTVYHCNDIDPTDACTLGLYRERWRTELYYAETDHSSPRSYQHRSGRDPLLWVVYLSDCTVALQRPRPRTRIQVSAVATKFGVTVRRRVQIFAAEAGADAGALTDAGGCADHVTLRTRSRRNSATPDAGGRGEDNFLSTWLSSRHVRLVGHLTLTEMRSPCAAAGAALILLQVLLLCCPGRCSVPFSRFIPLFYFLPCRTGYTLGSAVHFYSS